MTKKLLVLAGLVIWIGTNYKHKGMAGKSEDQLQLLAAELRKERFSRMEGSLGTEK